MAFYVLEPHKMFYAFVCFICSIWFHYDALYKFTLHCVTCVLLFVLWLL